MTTGNNIQIYRKRLGKTQEEFAEQMGVSRQTVSKWESDGCCPEMEKLLAMCELFGCDLDTLVRGDASESLKEDSAGYDAHMNQFTRQICVGTILVLCGVAVMFALAGLGVPEVLATIALFGFIIVAVGFFVVGGIQHGDFVKKHPKISAFYTDAQKEAYQKKFPVLLVAGIILVLLGVVFLMGMTALFGEARMDQDEQLEELIMAGFFVFLIVAAPILIYAGMQKGKYDLDSYNRDNDPEKTPAQKRISAANSCIMLAATAVFLVWGLVFHGWHICWIVYVVGGLLCGIFSVLGESRTSEDKKE